MGNGRYSNLYKGVRQNNNRTTSGAGSQAPVLSWSDAQKLRQQLNQDTVDDSTYVGTSRSFSINTWLRQQEGLQQSGWVSLTETSVKQYVAEIDSWMKPIPTEFQSVRLVDSDWLSGNFGTTDKSQIAEIINKNSIEIKDPAFMSVSTDLNRNWFASIRNTVLHIDVPANTEGYITANHIESEIVLHRNCTVKFSNARVSNGKLHIYGRLKENK